jgi:hypothetical protein
MVLAVATLTWLALLVGSVAICRAAAHGDEQGSHARRRRDATAAAHPQVPSRGASGRGRLSLGVLARDGDHRTARRLGRQHSAAG